MSSIVPLVLGLASSLPGPAALAEEKLSVVASFSIVGDMVGRVGGEHIELTTLVGPDEDVHVFAPQPADAQAVGRAGLLIVNGLGFEGWIDRLVEASNSRAAIIKVSEGVHALAPEAHDEHEEAEHTQASGSTAAGAEDSHDHGDADPHAWQDVRNAITYVDNIARALCDADKAHCDAYKSNAAAYIVELRALDEWIRTRIAAVPAERRLVITSHDAFGYFAKAYGLTFVAPEGVSTDSEASAADVAKLVEQIRANRATAVFLENVTDPRLIEQIGRDGGARVGGTLYSDALSAPTGSAPTYIDMMRHNVEVLVQAVAGS